LCSKRQGEKILPSHPIQQSEQSILPHFSGELTVDEEIKLSHEYFNQTEHNLFKEKHITPLSQLTLTPDFRTLHLLAQLVSKAYTDYRTGDLLEGWKLLKTESNSSRANG
jgi:hypothetical protein